MEERISAADANRKFSLLLRRIREGRSYVVTSHKKPVARPVHRTGAWVLRHPARGPRVRLEKQRAVRAERWTRDELWEGSGHEVLTDPPTGHQAQTRECRFGRSPFVVRLPRSTPHRGPAWANRQRNGHVEETMKPAKNTICLWYDGGAEEAARFYAKTFPDSSVGAVHRAPGDYPSGKEGDVLTVEFSVLGIPCLGLNGGPAFKHNEAFSFQVATADQAETDRYWDAIVGNGGQESACGWCKDKWGLSWQITPTALTEAFTGPDRAAAKRAFDAMMQMRKIDVAAIEAARRG
ncbi:MAG: type II toxin-antitoxin system prevent-host-death family antitoxin [Burkholderiales bacterium]|nr:type II toxin-antitoxin system prevent-host-death family antitoxin [Burkholderiales bacterium]